MSVLSSPNIPSCTSQSACFEKVNSSILNFDYSAFDLQITQKFFEYKNQLALSWHYFNQSKNEFEKLQTLCQSADFQSLPEQLTQISFYLNQAFESALKTNRISFEIIALEAFLLEQQHIDLIPESNLHIHYTILLDNLNQAHSQIIIPNSYYQNYSQALQEFENFAQLQGFQSFIAEPVTFLDLFHISSQRFPSKLNSEEPFFFPTLKTYVPKVFNFAYQSQRIQDSTTFLQQLQSFDLIQKYSQIAAVQNSVPSQFSILFSTLAYEKSFTISQNQTQFKILQTKLNGLELRWQSFQELDFNRTFPVLFSSINSKLIQLQDKIMRKRITFGEASKIISNLSSNLSGIDQKLSFWSSAIQQELSNCSEIPKNVSLKEKLWICRNPPKPLLEVSKQSMHCLNDWNLLQNIDWIQRKLDLDFKTISYSGCPQTLFLRLTQIHSWPEIQNLLLIRTEFLTLLEQTQPLRPFLSETLRMRFQALEKKTSEFEVNFFENKISIQGLQIFSTLPSLLLKLHQELLDLSAESLAYYFSQNPILEFSPTYTQGKLKFENSFFDLNYPVQFSIPWPLSILDLDLNSMNSSKIQISKDHSKITFIFPQISMGTLSIPFFGNTSAFFSENVSFLKITSEELLMKNQLKIHQTIQPANFLVALSNFDLSINQVFVFFNQSSIPAYAENNSLKFSLPVVSAQDTLEILYSLNQPILVTIQSQQNIPENTPKFTQILTFSVQNKSSTEFSNIQITLPFSSNPFIESISAFSENEKIPVQMHSDSLSIIFPKLYPKAQAVFSVNLDIENRSQFFQARITELEEKSLQLQNPEMYSMQILAFKQKQGLSEDFDQLLALEKQIQISLETEIKNQEFLDQFRFKENLFLIQQKNLTHDFNLLNQSLPIEFQQAQQFYQDARSSLNSDPVQSMRWLTQAQITLNKINFETYFKSTQQVLEEKFLELKQVHEFLASLNILDSSETTLFFSLQDKIQFISSVQIIQSSFYDVFKEFFSNSQDLNLTQIRLLKTAQAHAGTEIKKFRTLLEFPELPKLKAELEAVQSHSWLSDYYFPLLTLKDLDLMQTTIDKIIQSSLFSKLESFENDLETNMLQALKAFHKIEPELIQKIQLMESFQFSLRSFSAELQKDAMLFYEKAQATGLDTAEFKTALDKAKRLIENKNYLKSISITGLLTTVPSSSVFPIHWVLLFCVLLITSFLGYKKITQPKLKKRKRKLRSLLSSPKNNQDSQSH
ncbi:MAG: hypothetical protein Q7S92_02260 [Candidatus Diapherotrites archaeon]|nr:hypothetical protein [Candidatus Diapherotrites archaeon]